MAQLEIQVRHKEDIAILDVNGRLAVGGASTLRERVTGEMAEGHSNIILNLKDVDYIDSTGVGTMVICYTTLQKAGGPVWPLRFAWRRLRLK